MIDYDKNGYRKFDHSRIVRDRCLGIEVPRISDLCL